MHFINYLLFRLFTLPLCFLPYKAIHALGKPLGLLVYYLYPKYRKRALSNLALATSLHLSPDEIVRLAKASLMSLLITAMEYPKLYFEKNIHRIATCKNPEVAEEILKKTGKGVIFFVGHQANWELLFLEGTTRMKGVAIGRPIKNPWLYRFVTRLREKFGGKIIPPQNALKECLRALRSDTFVGIVGDQGMPNSGFSCPFLGRMAWTSPLPALLSARTGCPIFVATIHRTKGSYIILYSDPILPEDKTPENLMREVLHLFEKSVEKHPEEWLWVHNRFKQQLPGRIPKKLRHDAVLCILPPYPGLIEQLPRLRELYPSECLAALCPRELCPPSFDIEIIPYSTPQEMYIRDYRFKLVLNFTENRNIDKHFKRLSALEVLHYQSIDELLNYLK
ncbi:MAG: hypothetical protein JSR58_02710 [Verrucomicrobia bacterium]|nr:hypothetical protein [Verrucomicrobiota bacterium]